jgi:acyl-CoA thioesterase-1
VNQHQFGRPGYGVARRFINIALLFMLALSAVPTAAKAAEKRLLVLGDSLTAGYGLPSAQAFPVRLEAALRAKGVAVTVINAGVSGDTTAGGLARLDWSLADKPTHVIVALGANDMLRGLDPAQARRNLDQIMTRLRAEKLPVLIAGMLASRTLGAAYQAEFDGMYPALAKQHGAALYPFFLDGVATDPALNQNDGLHPNARGVEVIVERILPSVMTLLETPSS